MLKDVEAVTPYSTATPYAAGYPVWIPDEDIERIQAYNTYEWMYWSNDEAFELVRKPSDGRPIYLPTPRTLVDTTSHFLLKGLQITLGKENIEFKKILDDFLKREAFYSRFNTAKKAGVCRGDWIFHITADPLKDEGLRVSLNSVDPGSYFPVYDDDDLDKVIGVRLVEQIQHPDDPNKTLVKVLEYGYEEDDSGINRVWSVENLWETEGWNNPDRAVLVRSIIPLDFLDPRITQIPVYHFKSNAWDGQPFGSSELKGFERVFEAINQSMSDEDLALALTGLGVYATDAGRPMDDQGNERDWEVYPGVVLEVPGATMFKRVEGISTVTPVLDHIGAMKQSVYDASGTTEIALGHIDTQVAESSIALAIKFLPMQAKIDDRDQLGVDVLTQMFYDLKFWFLVYEGWDYLEVDIIPKLGEKLPLNRTKRVEELNNMLDRKVISRAYFRGEMEKLGYKFPPGLEEEILAEEVAIKEAMMTLAPAADPTATEQIGPGGRKVGAGDTLETQDKNKSNNKAAVNESKGTEVDPNKR